METEVLWQLARQALVLMLLASIPPIATSLVVGVAMGFLQAITQIHESSIATVPKLVGALIALVVTAPWVAKSLVQFSAQLFLVIGEVTW